MDKRGFTTYLEGKELAKRTQNEYIKISMRFFEWSEKEDIQVTKPDILKYLEHLKAKGLQNVSRHNNLLALNHYFTFLYQNGQAAANPCLLLKIRGRYKKKLHRIYTPEELDRLFDAYYQLFVRNYDDSHHRYEGQIQYAATGRERNALIVSILIYQGIRTKEIDKIELHDIDMIKATIKIRCGIRLNERILPLKATQMGLIINYLQNTRPKLAQYRTEESDKLFLSLPSVGRKETRRETLFSIFSTLTPQIKSIDKQFFNFQQVRASVITSWIKTQGLRKAQHMAGHRNIITTEKYMPNDLENLADDINKLHPF